MNRVVFKDWNMGLKTVELVKLLKEYGLSLAPAKKIVDDLLKRKASVISLPSKALAEELVDRATRLGAICEVMED